MRQKTCHSKERKLNLQANPRATVVSPKTDVSSLLLWLGLANRSLPPSNSIPVACARIGQGRLIGRPRKAMSTDRDQYVRRRLLVDSAWRPLREEMRNPNSSFNVVDSALHNVTRISK